MYTMGETSSELKTMESIQAINGKTPDMSPLTLRDVFAMSALSVFAGGSYNGTPLSMVCRGEYDTAKRLAEAAYKVADAMMEARNAGN